MTFDKGDEVSDERRRSRFIVAVGVAVCAVCAVWVWVAG